MTKNYNDLGVEFKYLIVNDMDQKYGLWVNTVGFQSIQPNSPYPLKDHPTGYFFNAQKGRILREYQLVYITKGRGVFSSETTPEKQVCKGRLMVLFPGQWHTYYPYVQTGWNEYYIGFEGAVIDDMVKGGFLSKEEMKSSYIDYSMSVIVARALPDVRDGFKPVHRRILYGMMELGNTSDKPYKKAARIVGEVLGKYHPHGDLSVYGALVRMAQDWAMRYPLVDGQGNFGSIDGDSAAAMRYTEARLKKIGEEMMQDLYKETVDFTNNFDDTLQEPTVMPTRIPNLLVNGASGIAVGMATNMPTHNLREVIDACVAYIDNNEIDVDGLMQYIKAPDFPTGGYVYGISGVRDAYETGRGRVVMRAKAEIESHPTHDKIVVTEIPYGVNKAELIKSIADLSNDKKIEGISNVNDETDREGMRIVIDIKRDANASVVLNKLYKMTMLQTSFGVNNVALVHGRPRLLNGLSLPAV